MVLANNDRQEIISLILPSSNLSSMNFLLEVFYGLRVYRSTVMRKKRRK